MRKLVKWIMVIAVCLVMAGCGVSDQDYIDFVKDGCPKLYPDISYREAFGAYFDDGKWEYFKSKDDEDVVEFTGSILYYGENTKLRMQFLLDYEDGTFEAHALKLDGVQQGDDLLISVIMEIFGDYQAEHGGDQQGAANDFTGYLSGGGTETDSAGRKIFYIGDMVQMSWDDGRSVEISFLDWNSYYDYAGNKCFYLEYEITNTGAEEITTGDWFNVYADNYAVSSYVAEGAWATLSPNRSTRGKLHVEVDPDSVSVIEVEFADAVLILKDDAAGSDIWSYEDGVSYSYLAGYYVGDSLYDMSISIYSSPERLMIGFVTLYQDGSAVGMGELFQEDDNFGLLIDGSVYYIAPYYSEGILHVNLLDGESLIETFYMQEHYES